MRKPWIAVLCFTLIVAVLLFALFLFVSGKTVNSNILDFHPTSFAARADAKFFYSIADELKFGDEITVQSPTLTRGRITNFLVAPDTTMIAVVVNGVLLIADGADQSVTKVTEVDSIYKEPKPMGRQFFRDDDFQWTRDSQTLYLIKDEYYDSKGSQLFSDRGELWRYDVKSKQLQMILKPFPAYSYFLGLHSGIYFSVPTKQGDLRMQYFNGRIVKDVGDVGAWAIPQEQLSEGFVESPFFSFSDRAFNELYFRGSSLSIDGEHGPERLVIGDRSYLAVSEGQGFKGAFYCSDLQRSTFLPGKRFFLFSVPYCHNYGGQLLVDTKTGQYETLPKDSRVYQTLDSDQLTTYRISSGGILAR